MIKLKDVTKYYSSDTSVTMALKNINLEFRKGEFVAITGKSGGGKSTLLNVISGMDTYEDGEMYFKGTETSYYDSKDWENYRRDNISFIYQSYNLIDSYTALENVESVMMICEEDSSPKARKMHRKRALDILDKVGLKKWARHKAVHLSSGQKQRLGIARALAKDTDVIIADEPTGNLDIENGSAVMKMLYELSKDRLVIVVTHNFEQVQEYATRKIRLFDGEVAEDLKLKPELYENGVFKGEDSEEQLLKAHEDKQSWKKAIRFVKQNRKAQPHRTFFIFSIMLVTIAAFFIMYGYLLGSLDDTHTKVITHDVFKNLDEERLLVRNPDGTPITDEDLEKIGDCKYVDYIEKYDFANEISCLYKKDTDYSVEYKKTENSSKKSISITALNYERFASSAHALDEEDLIAGRLPESKFEAVVSSTDESLIGTTVDIYFRKEHWSRITYLGGTFTVVGIVGEEYDSPFLSDAYLETINVNYGDVELELGYQVLAKSVYDDASKEDTYQENEKKTSVYLIKGDGLTGNQVRVSSAIAMNVRTEGWTVSGKTMYESLVTDASLKDITDKDNEKIHEVEIVDTYHDNSQDILEVSEELLEQLYGSSDITQISVYVDDYAYTDRSLKSIHDLGYEAISPYRASAKEYDRELVEENHASMMMSAGSVIVIFVLSVLVIYSMMKLKRKDFVILKSLGLQQRTINEMNYYELFTAGVGITALLSVVAVLAQKFEIEMIANLVKYYTWKDYVIVFILSMCMTLITGKLFNKHLSKFLGGKK